MLSRTESVRLQGFESRKIKNHMGSLSGVTSTLCGDECDLRSDLESNRTLIARTPRKAYETLAWLKCANGVDGVRRVITEEVFQVQNWLKAEVEKLATRA